MSSSVALEELTTMLMAFDHAYVLTVTDNGRSHVRAVTITADADTLVVDGAGRGSRRNAEARPAVTLLFPPLRPDDHALIVDGTSATVAGRLRVTPVRAVLHRPAPAAELSGADAPDGECVEVIRRSV